MPNVTTKKTTSGAPPSKRGRILVVDDELMLVAALRRLLSREHDVETATSGAMALERISAGSRFDVILCDLMMPGVTGIDVYEELARTAPDQAERMIFMTAAASASEVRGFLARLSNRCLDKPFDTRVLQACIEEILDTLGSSSGS